MPGARAKVWGIVKDILSFRSILLPILATLLPLSMVLNSESKATRCGYTMVVMAVLWLTEALPIPVTALIPIFMLPMLGVSTAKEVSSSYVTDTSMLFLGGLIVAVAVEEWKLHVRIALTVLRFVGSQPNLLMLGLMLPTWFLSMWISNTAAAAMMIPIVSAVTSQVKSASRANLAADSLEILDDMLLLESKSDGTSDIQKNESAVSTSISIKDEKDQEFKVNDKSTPVDENKTENNGTKNTTDVDEHNTRLGKALALSIAYAANTGGIATLTGSPPNLVFKAVVDEAFATAGKKYDGVEWSSGINFTSWLLFALPISFLTLLLGWLWLDLFVLRCSKSCDCFKKEKSAFDLQVREIITKEFKELGRITFAECLVGVMFACLAVLWIFREPPNISGWGDHFKDRFVSDSTPAMLIAVSLFVLPAKAPSVFCVRKPGENRYTPILNWEKTVQKVPWGVIVLLGGGFALAKASTQSGLSKWFGDSLDFLSVYSPLLLCLVVSLIVAAVTEVTSNTATATLLMPILQELSITAGLNPLYLMMSAAVACSFAFMLPVATPPSAIVFSHGFLTIPDMENHAWLWQNWLRLLFLTPMTKYGACTFPDALRGTWISSNFGNAEFMDTIMYLSQYDITADVISITPSNFTCDFNSGSYYVLRTANTYTSHSAGTYYWYLCLELTSITTYSYYYYNSRANTVGAGLYTVYTDVCQTGQATELFHVFVKEGSESEALSYCAKPFLGVFTYIHTSSSAECGLNLGDSLLDVCNNNRTNMVFDYSQCNTRVAFSAGGHVGCVATLNNGNTYYQSVINFDTTLSVTPRAYRFTCFVIEFDGENVTASEKGENCVSGQTATVKPSAPGSLLYLVANTTCYIATPTSPEESDNTAAIVAAVVVTILVIAIIIGAVLGYRYFKKKQEEKLLTKRKINPLITVGTVGSLKKMPEPLVNMNHSTSKTKDTNLSNNNNRSTDKGLNNNNRNKGTDDISSNTDKTKDDNKAVPPPEILVTIDGELQDVDADKEIKEQKVPEIDERNGDKVDKDKADKIDKTEHREEKNIPNGTVTVFDLTLNEADVLKTNQPNGVISKGDVENKSIKEMGEKVNSESVKTEKRVTFPDQPPEGLGKREKTMLPTDEAKGASNEEVSNFGKDKTGMNSRMSTRGGVKPAESSGSLDVLFGKNGVLKPEPQDPHSTLGPRDHTLTDIII